MSKITLHIYNNEMSEVVKTYEADNYNISYGIVEDLLTAIDLTKVDANNQMAIGVSVAKALYSVKPIVKQLFQGLTDEELRNTLPNELINITVTAVTETFGQVFSDLGNATRG